MEKARTAEERKALAAIRSLDRAHAAKGGRGSGLYDCEYLVVRCSSRPIQSRRTSRRRWW